MIADRCSGRPRATEAHVRGWTRPVLRTTGLEVAADQVVVRGLQVAGFPEYGIHVTVGGNVEVLGNELDRRRKARGSSQVVANLVSARGRSHPSPDHPTTRVVVAADYVPGQHRQASVRATVVGGASACGSS